MIAEIKSIFKVLSDIFYAREQLPLLTNFWVIFFI